MSWVRQIARVRKIVSPNGSGVRPVRIIYVWTVVFLAMVLYAIAWYALGSVAMTIIQSIDNSMTFDPPWDSVTAFVKYCVLLHPIISLVGWFIYGFLNSARRDRTQWEY